MCEEFVQNASCNFILYVFRLRSKKKKSGQKRIVDAVKVKRYAFHWNSILYTSEVHMKGDSDQRWE